MLALGVVLTFLCVASLTEGCGKRPYGVRVVGGVDALPHSWPWQISLRLYGGHICGGSLIRPDWVVTAAHCVYQNQSPGYYTVVVGAHRQTESTSVQQTHNVDKVIIHESFSMSYLRNDIALLKLSSPVTLSAKVNLVCLPPKGSKVPPGTKCFITGWGRTVGGGAAADTLQQGEMPVQSHSDCSARNSYLVPVDEDSMVCAGSGVANQAGGCQGDSGGPFVCEENGKWILRGAVSWGHYYCQTDHFTVFARVSNFLDWIEQKISGGGVPTPSVSTPADCDDRMQGCQFYKDKKYCTNYPDNMKYWCAKTCFNCNN